ERVVAVANHTYGSEAINEYLSQFAGRHFQHRVLLFLVGELCSAACAACKLSTLAGLHLDVVYVSTERHVLHRKGVTDFRSHIQAADNLCANLQSLRSDDVSLFSISIFDQCDECCTVRIVLDRHHSSFYIEFIALEVDDTVFLFVTTTTIPHGKVTRRVTTTGPLLRLYECVLGYICCNLRIRITDPPTGTGCNWFEFS